MTSIFECNRARDLIETGTSNMVFLQPQEEVEQGGSTTVDAGGLVFGIAPLHVHEDRLPDGFVPKPRKVFFMTENNFGLWYDTPVHQITLQSKETGIGSIPSSLPAFLVPRLVLGPKSIKICPPLAGATHIDRDPEATERLWERAASFLAESL